MARPGEYPESAAQKLESAIPRQQSAAKPPAQDVPAGPYRKIALDLQQQVDAMYHSRTWQLTLACGLARRSFREALRLPGRMWRILSQPAGQAASQSSDGLPSRRPASRHSKIVGWPKDRPFVSVVVLSTGDPQALLESMASLRASTLQDFEIVLVSGRSDDHSGAREAVGDAGARLRELDAEYPDSAEGRNTAVAAASGKYVVLLRAGDRLDPTFLEKAALTLDESTECGFAYAGTAAIQNAAPSRSEPFSLERALRYNPVPDSALFRLEAWSEAGGFHGDPGIDLWAFWVALGTQGWRGLFLHEELVHPGLESRRAHQLVRNLAPDSEEAGQVRRRHAELLKNMPASRPGVTQATPNGGAADSLLAESLGFQQRPFLNFASGKPAILCVVPWLDVGGAEQVVLQLMRGLSKEFSFAVAATLPAEHNRAADFREVTPWIYHLPETDAGPGPFLADLAARHGIQGVLISSSQAGYQALPALKQRGLWTADIVHNTSPEGRLDAAIRFDRYLDLHFACGRSQAEALRESGNVDNAKIRTVWTAVDAAGRYDPDRYRLLRDPLRAEFGLRSQDVVLTYVGRLSIEKDVPLFVEAVAEIVRRHPDVPLRALIAGEGPERLRVEEAIERAGLGREVRLLGDSRRVPEILALSDYQLLTSKTEGSPITILEAMSLKLIVLSTGVGNIRDVIEDGVNGFVVENRDASAFADRFERIHRDGEKQRQMREAARRAILERFDEQQMLSRYREALCAALPSRRAGPSV